MNSAGDDERHGFPGQGKVGLARRSEQGRESVEVLVFDDLMGRVAVASQWMDERPTRSVVLHRDDKVDVPGRDQPRSRPRADLGFIHAGGATELRAGWFEFWGRWWRRRT